MHFFRFLILVALLVPTFSFAAASKIPIEARRNMVCDDLLGQIRLQVTDVRTAEESIAANAKDRKTVSTAQEKEYLYLSTKEWINTKNESYRIMSSLVSVYVSINCDKNKMIAEMYCPSGWSSDCE